MLFDFCVAVVRRFRGSVGETEKRYIACFLFVCLALFAGIYHPLAWLIPSFAIALLCVVQLAPVPRIFLATVMFSLTLLVWQLLTLVLILIFARIPAFSDAYIPSFSSGQIIRDLADMVIAAAITAWTIRAQSRSALLTLAGYHIGELLLAACGIQTVTVADINSFNYYVELFSIRGLSSPHVRGCAM